MKVDIEKIIIKAIQSKMSVYITDDSVSISPWGGAEPTQTELEPEPEPEPKKPAPKKPAGKINIDMGKVKALRNAGWSYDKIGDEMGVSAQTIANRMKEYEQ